MLRYLHEFGDYRSLRPFRNCQLILTLTGLVTLSESYVFSGVSSLHGVYMLCSPSPLCACTEVRDKLIYFVKQPLHVSGMYIAHHQEVFTVYVQQLVRVIRLGDWQLAGSGWNTQ
jgi:hypothetical protein